MKDTVKTTRFEPSPCPGCGHFHDAATDLLPGVTPTDGQHRQYHKLRGDFNLPTTAGGLRKPTETELKNMKANAELWKTIQRHRLAVTMTKANSAPCRAAKTQRRTDELHSTVVFLLRRTAERTRWRATRNMRASARKVPCERNDGCLKGGAGSFRDGKDYCAEIREGLQEIRKGDRVTVTIEGRTLKCVVTLASRNGRSLAVSVDEGVPLPFALDRSTGLQSLLLLQADDGTWSEIVGDRPVEVEDA